MQCRGVVVEQISSGPIAVCIPKNPSDKSQYYAYSTVKADSTSEAKENAQDLYEDRSCSGYPTDRPTTIDWKNTSSSTGVGGDIGNKKDSYRHFENSNSYRITYYAGTTASKRTNGKQKVSSCKEIN